MRSAGLVGLLGLAGLVALLARQEDRPLPDAGQILWEPSLPQPTSSHPAYPPGLEVRTVYPSNPNDYFAVNEAPATAWELRVNHPTSAAVLESVPDRPDGARVRIDVGGQPVTWHIQLDRPRLPVVQGRRYRLSYRARAVGPRTMTEGIGQSRAPWRGLGWYREQDLEETWREYTEFFEANASEQDARVHFDLGGHPGVVEIDNVVLTDLDTNEPVQPQPRRDRYFVSYWFNGEGCRGTDTAPLPASGLRILTLGGGFALGIGVHEADTFGARLAATLRERQFPAAGGPVDVINCGVHGTGSDEAGARFDRLASIYQPKVVILALDTSDIARLDDMRRGWLAAFGPLPTRLIEHEAEVISELHRRSLARGARLVTALLEPTGRGRFHARVRDALARRLESAGIAVVRVAAPLDAGPWQRQVVHPDIDVHPNHLVHRATADALAAFLMRAPLG